MTPEELQEFIAEGESLHREFKSARAHPDALAAAFVSFLNTEGGVVLLGVEDDGTISGVGDDVDKARQRMDRILSNNITPKASAYIETISVAGQNILKINLARGLDRPYTTQRGQCFIRLNTDKRLASRQEMRRLFLTVSMLLAVAIGIPVGVIGAAYRGTAIDQVSRVVTIAGVSIPSFWLALLLQLLFFGVLEWLPLGGRLSRELSITNPIESITGFYLIDGILTGNWEAWRDALWHLILPTFVLATYPISLTARMTRASMLEVLSETYIMAAEAAGLSRREILFKLALKNAIIPTLTVLGLVFAFSITGAILVEIVFSWPGLGTYVTDSILAADFPVVMAVILIVTIIYVTINLIIDLLQASLDPRMRLG